MNGLKTFLLMIGLMFLFVFVGGAIGGNQGMIIAFVFACCMNFFAYWFSDKVVLSMYKAKEVNEQEFPRLYAIVRNLADRANLPMPRVYIIPAQVPNAFATGRNPENAAVAVTQSLLEVLNEEELGGVLAHELSHIKNRDILISTIAATLAGAITMLAYLARFSALFGGRSRSRNGGGIIGLLAMAILAPIAAMLIQMAISRSREYLADSGGGEISGNPLALADALKKLEYAAQRNPG
ncbi:zinc metalloprotease HtpX, partial [bacterium]|nr:zinc metalloprotease HtpX [bacterium]